MQHQLCPRCKFRITSNKAICTTCGYSLHNTRKGSEPSESSRPERAIAAPVASKGASNAPKATPTQDNSPSSSLRKVQSAAQGPSFWRTFFGLDQIATEKSEP